MLKVSIDLTDMKRVADKIGSVEPYFREQIWDDLYRLAVDVESDVKGPMPVDTGRAKSGWGHYTPEFLHSSAKSLSKHGRVRKFHVVGLSGRTEISSETDAIWKENKNDLEIIQGTNVPYTEFINAGSRGRGGTHHIDMASLRAEIRAAQWAIDLADYFVKFFKK